MPGGRADDRVQAFRLTGAQGIPEKITGDGPWTFQLVRDTPAVADFNGDGIDELIVAPGQSDEVLILLGGKAGLRTDRLARLPLEYRVHYEHGVYAADFNSDGRMDLAEFGYTNTGVGAGGPPAVYLWLQ